MVLQRCVFSAGLRGVGVAAGVRSLLYEGEQGVSGDLMRKALAPSAGRLSTCMRQGITRGQQCIQVKQGTRNTGCLTR